MIDWDASSHPDGYAQWLTGVLADGGSDARALCELAGEPLVEGMLVGLPHQALNVSQRRELEDKKTAFQRMYIKKWVDSGIDAIICPVLPWVAYSPKTWVKSKQSVGYTAIWNFLSYSALAIPVATAIKSSDQPGKEWMEYVPRNDADEFNKEQCECILSGDRRGC